MNGTGQQPSEQRQPMPLTADTPVAYYTPIAITPATIKWVAVAICGAIWSLYTADWLYRPAKQADFEALTRVVQTLQTGQAEAQKAVERLTLAVDNLSGLVNDFKQSGKIKNAITLQRIR